MDDYLKDIEDTEGEDGLHALADKLDEDSLSTAFSGIGGPEVSLLWLHQSLQARLGDRVLKRPKIMSQIEWDVVPLPHFGWKTDSASNTCAVSIGVAMACIWMSCIR